MMLTRPGLRDMKSAGRLYFSSNAESSFSHRCCCAGITSGGYMSSKDFEVGTVPAIVKEMATDLYVKLFYSLL
jgi:hypothetical protein